MDLLRDSKEIYIDETERKPNLYAANVLLGIVVVIAFVCAMNEMGVFQVSRLIIGVCFLMSLTMFLVMQFIVHKSSWIIHPAVKYLIMTMVLFLVLTLTVLLNIHAVLAFVLPLLLATQYRSHGVSRLALLGSVICCGLAPILSYFLKTWSQIFLTGYIQTFCRVTIDVTPGNSITDLEALKEITLFWSLPQMLTICAFGVILYASTKSGIDSVNHQVQIVRLSNDLNHQLDSILSMQEKVLCSMSDIIENRDVETGGHVKRTSEIVRMLVNEIRKDPERNLSPEFCENTIRSAPMHDLGKISVPDSILRKPGKLTTDEFNEVKKHPQRSADIIVQVLTGIEDESLLNTAVNVAKYHHERFDGTGYPEQLAGNEIPLEARIMAIADVYDALVSERCYKASMDFREAFDTIEKSMGTQFDPGLNKYFLACRYEIEKFYKTN